MVMTHSFYFKFENVYFMKLCPNFCGSEVVRSNYLTTSYPLVNIYIILALFFETPTHRAVP